MSDCLCQRLFFFYFLSFLFIWYGLWTTSTEGTCAMPQNWNASSFSWIDGRQIDDGCTFFPRSISLSYFSIISTCGMQAQVHILVLRDEWDDEQNWIDWMHGAMRRISVLVYESAIWCHRLCVVFVCMCIVCVLTYFIRCCWCWSHVKMSALPYIAWWHSLFCCCLIFCLFLFSLIAAVQEEE